MNAVHFISAVSILIAAADVRAAPTDGNAAISYHCNDVVVVGTLQNIEDSFRHVDIEDDSLGHGWMTAYVRVKRVLKGTEARSAVHADYFGHTFFDFRPGKRYLIVLGPTGEGPYSLRSFLPWKRNNKSKLAKACS